MVGKAEGLSSCGVTLPSSRDGGQADAKQQDKCECGAAVANATGRASAGEASGATRRTGAWGGDSVFIKLARI